MSLRIFFLLAVFISSGSVFAANANRLAYLMEPEPFSVDANFPKLATAQWVGETNIEAVVTFGIDDMRGTEPYERMLRPILERLKKIDGRAPASIFSVAPSPENPQLQAWLKEGVSIEVHTLTHPCPILAKSNFVAAANTFFGCIDLLAGIPGNRPVAFRTPCCDSINSASPRLFAELMCKTAPSGRFLTMDSSVVLLFTTNDTSLTRADLFDGQGKPRFTKYVPFPSFKTTIENYPFPYVIHNALWEMPFVAPSDWESHNIQGDNSPQMLEDWKKALDIIVRKGGIFNFVLHPHGWSASSQFVDFIDHAETAHAGKVRFLNYPEVEARINKNLLSGQPLRAANGGDNGVRLLDLDADGFLDVAIGNEAMRRTRVWDPAGRKWRETDFPATMNEGVRFGIVRENGAVSMLVANESRRGAWTFDGSGWKEDRDLLNGLETIFVTLEGRDRGGRFRDVDNDGVCEFIVSNEMKNLVFAWDGALKRWKAQDFALPRGTAIVNREGLDNGLRFVDVNEDGFDDVIFSNEERFSLHLFIPKLYLGFARGWTRQVSEGKRGEPEAIPAFVRAGTNRNNGAWFHSKTLWVQNEDTAHLPDLVERRTFAELLVGSKPAAKSPEEALKCFVPPEGFEIELVAAEPKVLDPVAFEWDAKGQLWVAEMRDYPLGIHGKAGGVITLLRDADGDGKYETATEFLKGVNFPSGVMPWREGVLISAAPDIIYAEDTNGDGVADLRKTLVTGFAEGNQQHRFNGFEMGLDGWVYGANGDSGGSLKVLEGVLNKSGATGKPVRLRGDFRFKPDTGELEVIEGTTQFGRRRDDWDNWFGNNNPTWLWHYYLPSRFVERNPHLRVADLRVVTADNNRLFPPPKTQQRFNDIGKGNTASAANSPAPYRDELFGPEFATSVFISDPSFNLIHREVLAPDGVSFKSHRAASEQDREFLTSTDPWFRPTMLKTGPDGALYIADMYRFVLEHPEWIPPDVQKAMDLRAGEDKGRIYRIFPKGVKLRATPSLHALKSADLARRIDSANGWERDTVQKLLVWRADLSAVSALRTLAAESARPLAQAQALWTLRLLGALAKADVLKAFKNPDARVRAQAVRVGENFEETAELVEDEDKKVAFEAALVAGGLRSPQTGEFLVAAARRNVDDPRFLNAVYSSALPHLTGILEPLVDNPPKSPALVKLAAQCFAFAGAGALDRDRARTVLKNGAGIWRFAALRSWLDASGEQAGEDLKPLIAEARELALDASAEEEERKLAVGLVSDIESLQSLLAPGTPPSVQRAALAQLGKSKSSEAPGALVAAWKEASPGIKQDAINLFFTRTEWIEKLLAGLERGEIPANAIDASKQQSLRKHGNSKIARRAEKLFAAVNANRREVLAKYAEAGKLTGDAANGAALYRQTCAACHRFRDEGSALGPDLGSVSEKPFDYLLAAILDPNQAVEARYFSYSAVTKKGEEFSGVISAETAGAVTLTGANGATQTFLRGELQELKTTGMSLMPEGLESGLSPQGAADLIAYLRTRN